MEKKIITTIILLTIMLGVGCMFSKKEYSYKELEKSYSEKNFSYEKFWKQHNKLDKNLISEIPDEKLIDVVNDFMIYNIGNSYGKDEEKILTKFPEPFIAAYIIRMLEGEVNNGGYDQYFYNSSGYYVYEAIEYLNKIGAKSTAELTERALSLVNNENLNRETFKSKQINRELEYDDVSDELSEIDDKFYEYPEDLENLLIKYISNNINLIG